MCRGGVNVDVLCPVGWESIGAERAPRKGGDGRDERGVFFEDFSEEGGLGGGREEPGWLISVASLLSVSV